MASSYVVQLSQPVSTTYIDCISIFNGAYEHSYGLVFARGPPHHVQR